LPSFKAPAPRKPDHQCESVAIGTFKGSNVFRQMWSTLYIPEGTREQLQWFNH